MQIKYYKDPSQESFELHEFGNIAEFIITKGFSRDEILDLRFFNGGEIGEEILTTDAQFLTRQFDSVLITHDSKLPKGGVELLVLAASLLISAATVFLVPKVRVPDNIDGRQSSSTNRTGAPSNEPRTNQRVDDIFGRVTRHAPALIQVPYPIGINNKEYWCLYGCVGRGEYDIAQAEIFDGVTRSDAMAGAACQIYEPNQSPIAYTSRQINFGRNLAATEKIGIYSKSNEVSEQELLPPNEIPNAGATLLLSGNADGTQATFDFTSPDPDFDLNEYYTVGEVFDVDGVFKIATDGGSVNLRYISNSGAGSGVVNHLTYAVESLSSGGFEVLSIAGTSMTVAVPSAVQSAWANLTSYNPYSKTYYTLVDGEIVTDDQPYNTQQGQPWIDIVYEDKVGQPTAKPISKTTSSPSFGAQINGEVGAFKIPEGVTEIRAVFSANNGFYKLVDNNTSSVTANIEIKFTELDVGGNPTGNTFTEVYVATSNNQNPTLAVYDTPVYTVPYTRCTVSFRRTTNRDKSSNVSAVDRLNISDLYFFEPIDPAITDFGDVTTIHYLVPPSGQQRSRRDNRINLHVTRKIKEDGTGALIPSDDAGLIALNVALDPLIGRCAIDNVDAVGLLTLKSQIDTYFGRAGFCRFGYNFDSDQLTFEDHFALIAQAINCVAYGQNNIYSMTFEKPQSVKHVITQKVKLDNSEVWTNKMSQRFDGVEVIWRDEGEGVDKKVSIPNRSISRPDRVTLGGVLTESQAKVIGWRRYNKLLASDLSVSVDVAEFGRILSPSARVEMPDGTRYTFQAGDENGYTVYDGEIVDVNGLTLTLSTPVVFMLGLTYSVKIIHTDATVENLNCEATADPRKILLTQTPTKAIYNGWLKDKPRFMLYANTTTDVIPLMITGINSTISDNRETNTVEMIRYSESYYGQDLLV